MAVRQPRKEVRPRQRARIGVGDIDLELRDHHEQGHRADGPRGRGENLLPRHQVHLVGVHRARHGNGVAHGQPGQQRPAQHLQHPQDDPAGPTHEHRRPPTHSALRALLGHEAQVVGLLAHLRDQGNAHRQRRAKGQHVELAIRTRSAWVSGQILQDVRMVAKHIDEGQHQHHQPDGLRDQLQAADDRHPMGDQRHHHQRTDQIAPGRRDVERQIQRIGHHGRFQRKEDEGEGRVDQRGDGRADVAKARAPREQVHVQAVAGRVHADGPAHQQDDQPRRQNRPEGVDEAVVHQQGRPQSLQHQKGCHPEGRVGHPRLAPAPGRARREAQRVILQSFGRHPAVVVPTHLHHALQSVAGGLGGEKQVWVLHGVSSIRTLTPQFRCRRYAAPCFGLEKTPWN